MRWFVVLLVGLLCLALSSCPKSGGGDDNAPGMTNNNSDNGNSDSDSSSDENLWDE